MYRGKIKQYALSFVQVQPEKRVCRNREVAKRGTLNAVFLCPQALSKAGHSVCDLRFSELMIRKHPVVWDGTPYRLAGMY
jgi:hypothetical protein